MITKTMGLLLGLGGLVLLGCGSLPAVTLAPDPPLPCLVDEDCQAGDYCDLTRMECWPNTDGDTDADALLDGDTADENDTVDAEPYEEETDEPTCPTLRNDPTPGFGGISLIDLGVVNPGGTSSATFGVTNTGATPVTFFHVYCTRLSDGSSCDTSIWWLASITFPRGYSKALERGEEFQSFSINPGETTYFTVLFTPTSYDLQDVQFALIADSCETSKFRITANEGVRSELLVYKRLQPQVIAPGTISVSPSVVEQCKEPLELAYTACNKGQKSLTLNGFKLSPLQGSSQFAALSDAGYPLTLGPEACVDITVSYQASGSGFLVDLALLSIDNDASNTGGLPYSFTIQVNASLRLFMTDENAGDFGKVIPPESTHYCTSYHQEVCPPGQVCCALGQLCIAGTCSYERVVPLTTCKSDTQSLVWTARIAELSGDSAACSQNFKIKTISPLNPGAGLPGLVSIGYTPPPTFEGLAKLQKCSLVLSTLGESGQSYEEVVPLKATLSEGPVARLSRESHGPIITEPITAAVGDTVCLWADVSYDPDVSASAVCGGMNFAFSWAGASADTSTVSIVMAEMCPSIQNDEKIAECLTFDRPGTYIRRLTVTDADGLSDHVDVTITIAAYKYGLRVNYEKGQETPTTMSTVDVLLTLISPNGSSCKVAGSGGLTTSGNGSCSLSGGAEGVIFLREDTDSMIDVLLKDFPSGQYQIKIKYLNDCSIFLYQFEPAYCAAHLSPNHFKLELYKDYNGVIAEQILFSTEAELSQVGGENIYWMNFPNPEILTSN